MDTKSLSLGKYVLLTAGVLFAFLFAGCSRTPKDLEEKTVVLRLNAHTMRAIDDVVTGSNLTVSTFESVTLYFWDQTGKQQVYPFAKVFRSNTPEMEQLMGDGYTIDVAKSCKRVSAHCNQSTLSIEGDILKYQGKDKFKTLPYVAEKAEITAGSGGVSQVKLFPKPLVARLEVFGSITPTLNSKGKSAYTDMKITGIYINNFVQTRGNAQRLLCTKENYNINTGVWSGHPTQMRNTAAELNQKIAAVNAGIHVTPDVYYVYPDPSNTPTEMDHLILRLSYKLKGVQHDNRFLTFVSFLEQKAPNTKVAKFNPGFIYRIDLSQLGELFTTDENGYPDDPTSDKPEEKQLVKAIGVVVDPWEPVEIPVEL